MVFDNLYSSVALARSIVNANPPTCPAWKGDLGRQSLKRKHERDVFIARSGIPAHHAGVAQLVEQLICNQQVGGSNPSASSNSPS